jgi:predicted nucleic acid-binding protein
MKERKIAAFLNRHQVFAADTMLFIYHFEDHKRYASVTEKLLVAWEKGAHRGVTSIITLLEVLVKPKRDDNPDAVRDYRDLLLSYPNLQMVPVDVQCAETASDLRARYGIKTPDAIQVSAALLGGATAFVTNDDQLKQVNELEVVLLEELVR